MLFCAIFPSTLEYWLSWSCVGLMQATTAVMSSRVQRPCHVWKIIFLPCLPCSLALAVILFPPPQCFLTFEGGWDILFFVPCPVVGLGINCHFLEKEDSVRRHEGCINFSVWVLEGSLVLCEFRKKMLLVGSFWELMSTSSVGSCLGFQL